MSFSLTEAYKRFPVVPLTKEIANDLGHIDYFESDNEQEALARLVSSVATPTSAFNAAVWMPTGPRMVVDGATLQANAKTFETENAWLLKPSNGRTWVSRYYEDGRDENMGGMSRAPYQMGNDDISVGEHARLMCEKLQTIASRPVYGEIRVDATRPHFATDYKISAPHIDGSETAPLIRILEYYHGPGSYMVANSDWNSYSYDSESRTEKLEWAKPDAEIIAKILEVPQGAVIAMNSSFFSKPILHGTPLDAFEDGEVKRSSRMLGVYTL